MEFLGRSPHGVALASDEGDHPENQEAAKNQRNRFNALYLSESAQHPAMPFKTLVMAAREFSVGRRLKLESVGGTFTIRLKEPIEEQGDFAWLPYEVLDRRKAGESAPMQRADGKPIATLPTNASPRTVNSGEGADVVAPEPDKRVAGAGNT